MLGINKALKDIHIRAALQNWSLQREVHDNPTCDLIYKQDTQDVPSYLDNKTEEITVPNIPVLVAPIKYRNQYGKVIVEEGLYFIFLDSQFKMTKENKDVKIFFEDNTYTVVSILNDDSNSGLTRVEGARV